MAPKPKCWQARHRQDRTWTIEVREPGPDIQEAAKTTAAETNNEVKKEKLQENSKRELPRMLQLQLQQLLTSLMMKTVLLMKKSVKVSDTFFHGIILFSQLNLSFTLESKCLDSGIREMESSSKNPTSP